MADKGHTERRWRTRLLGVGMVASAIALDYLPLGSAPGEWVWALPLRVALLVVGMAMVLDQGEAWGANASEEMSRRALLIFQAFIALIVLAAVIQSVGFGFPTFRGDPPQATRYAVTTLYGLVLGTAAIAGVLSLALTFRASERPEARSLALFMALLALFWGPFLGALWFEQEPGSLNFGATLGGRSHLTGLMLATLMVSVCAFVRFSALFPRRLGERDLGPSRFRPLRAVRVSLLKPSIVWGIGSGLAMFFTLPYLRPDSGGAGSVPANTQPYTDAWATVLMFLFVGVPFLGMNVGASNLRTSYVRSDKDERKKILWVVVGCVGGTAMVLASLLGAFVGSVPLFDWVGYLMLLLPFAPLVLVVCLAIAIFYKGTIHPALVIKRTTVYGALGILLLAATSAAESLLSEVLENALGFSSLASAASLGALIAIAVIPLRGPLGRLLSAWLPAGDGQRMTTDHVTP